MGSWWGIPCSLTAGLLTHNWLGSHSISASRPSLMLVPLVLPLSAPLPASSSLVHSVTPALFFLPPSVHSLRIVYRRIVVALIKINIILIQTDIKRHRASKAFLCGLLISSCFSTPFIFCSLIPFDPLFRGLLWVSLDRHVWAQFRCYIWQVWWSGTENPWAAFFWDISLCDKYPRYWHTKALQQRLGERHTLNVILIFHKISQE